MKKYFFLILLLVLLDQGSKFILYGRYIFFTSFFSLTSVENTGVAFGLFQGNNLFFVVLSLIILVVILFNFSADPLPLSFIIAGLFGNLIDRVFFGFVRDFISVSIWPVFNLADSSITIGVLLLFLHFWKEKKIYKLQGSRKE